METTGRERDGVGGVEGRAHPDGNGTRRRAFVDLSHTIESGMITHRGIPAPLVCDYLSREASRALYEPGTEFHIGRIELVANTGTYIDAPSHRYADGAEIADLDLEAVAELPGIVVRAPWRGGRAVEAERFAGLDVQGRAVLVHTGWAEHWRSDRYVEDHPYLTEGAAVLLRDAGARLVGIDSMNIDDTRGRARPVHSVLLRSGVLIAEHLRGLEQLPESGFDFFAVPVKVRGMGTFPVRAFARVVVSG